MEIKTIDSAGKPYQCSLCCIEPICGSALYRALDNKISLPNCNNGKLYFQVENGDTDLWLEEIRKEMLELLKSNL